MDEKFKVGDLVIKTMEDETDCDECPKKGDICKISCIFDNQVFAFDNLSCNGIASEFELVSKITARFYGKKQGIR
jgi:MinD superfamily P-loop ATPase